MRGILRCHCGDPISGGPFKGKSKKAFFYYRCRHKGHNLISAIKSHNQFLGACELMSLISKNVKEVIKTTEAQLASAISDDKEILATKRRELTQREELLYALEEKWITVQIAKDTRNILELKSAIAELDKVPNLAFGLLKRNLELVTDMKYVYTQADTLSKKEFIAQVFDKNLYYENAIYQTPTMLRIFTHKCLIMKKKKGFFCIKKGILKAKSL